MKSSDFLKEDGDKVRKLPKRKHGFVGNIENETIRNTEFRRVLFSTQNMQLVLMSLKPGEEIGEEVHEVAQFIRNDQGTGVSIMDGEKHDFSDGDAVVVPAGVRHNIINTGSEDMKLYTVYAPPQHEPGTVNPTKPAND